MMALHDIVKSGKALYVGISNYQAAEAKKALEILKKAGTPCLIHQPKYSMFERWVENGLLDVLEEYGVGCIPFSPLAQGMLTDRYIKGIPANSRASKEHGFLKKSDITPGRVEKIKRLNGIAARRNQSLAQMAIAWVLRDPRVTSALIGARSVEQLDDSLDAVNNLAFSEDELGEIEEFAREGDLDLWAESESYGPGDLPQPRLG